MHSLSISRLFWVIISPLFLSYALVANANDYDDQKKSKLSEILSRSVFGSNTPPDSLADGRLTNYDPLLVSVVASLRSRSPNRKMKKWEQVSFPPNDGSKICSKNLDAFYKKSETNSPYTFVVLPGSYASWKRGSFTSQTVSALNQGFNDPNILSFAGYLSPAFLSGACSQIPWDGISMAKDFYLRINKFLDQQHVNREKTGIVGFSGGGFLTLAMLAHDSELSKAKNTSKLFSLGGASFSPILHGRTAFENLDIRHRNSKIDRTLGLTTIDWDNFWYMVKNLGPPSWEQVIDLYDKNPSGFIDRAFNEFTAVDLKDTLEAVEVDYSEFEKELSYYSAYVKNGYGGARPSATNEKLNSGFDIATDVRPLLNLTDAPLLIYFSQDDPVLSSHNSAGQPDVITNILETASQNPMVTVFNPKFGAHTGALLDPIFEELIISFFSDNPDKIDSSPK